MKILLINPNRYHYPLVIPLAIEYLAGALIGTQHTFDILDLCFSKDPILSIEKAIQKIKPDITGISIRQIDTVLYRNNEFFLDDIKNYISVCKNNHQKVILGGSGFSIMPTEILQYTGADYGIYGPGEIALTDFLTKLEKKEKVEKLIDGYQYFDTKHYNFKRLNLIDYKQYTKNGGIIGFRTQIGCNANCIFCTEGNKKLIFHDPESVGIEIANLNNKGFKNFHLCDSEFNMNLDHCIDICQSIVKMTKAINWTLYMKPEPFSEELFYWLNKSGANLITLSLDTNATSMTSFSSLEKFFEYTNKFDINIAIDLSTGFPYEKHNNLKDMVKFLDKQPISTIGINSFYRIYPGTPLHKMIEQDNSLEKYLIHWEKGTNYICPVFYNSISEDNLKKVIAGKKKFRIEGFEKVTNYQRV